MYGMTKDQEGIVQKLCQMAKESPFVAGQACDVLEMKVSEVFTVLKILCDLGVLECPETPGLGVTRYRVSSQCFRRLADRN